MAQAILDTSGGRAISTWTVHCWHCGTAVAVHGAEGESACSRCGVRVRAAGAATATGEPPPGAPSPASDPADSLVGARVGPYLLERLLGRGGMGRVYEARAGTRRVALKVLSDALVADPHFVRRFQREAKVLATLSHPHVVEVLDQGEEPGDLLRATPRRLWFAMEYVRGENLRRRLERGALPPAEAARVAGEIAAALAYAHERGVIHRDLKPENVLLGEDGRVRLADFGLLRLARETTPEATTRLTRTDVILGTYEYMSPEQRRGSAEVDGRADLFALGVMLYECLTGRLPLGRFRPASEFVPGLPRGVDAVIHQALAPEPKDRPASAQAFRDALRAAMESSAAATFPPPLRPHAHAGDLPPEPPRLPETASSDARVLNHVEILALLDKIAAILLIVSGGILSLALVGIPFLIGGVLLLHVSRRLRQHRAGAREAQIAASILLCLVFPLGTALGIYGLIVVAPRAAADALDRERLRREREAEQAGRRSRRWWRPSGRHGRTSTHAEEGASDTQPPPLPPSSGLHSPLPLRRVEFLLPEPRRAAGFLLRGLVAAAVLWTLFLGLSAAGAARPVHYLPFPDISNVSNVSVRHGAAQSSEVAGYLLPYGLGSLAGLALASLAATRAWRRRRERRGVGLAFTALALFAGDVALVAMAWHRGLLFASSL